MADITSSGFAEKAPVRFVKKEAIQKRLMLSNELLIAASGAGPCGRPLWCSPLLCEKNYKHPVIYSNFVKKFTFKSSAEAIFAEMTLMPMYLDNSIGEFITGTSVPNLDAQGLLSGFKVIVPRLNLLEIFEKFYRRTLDLKFSKEKITLATLRDTLLPKLLSGQLSLGAAQDMLEAG